MTVRELLRWQWEGYSRYHQSRANLGLHVVAVPLFIASNVCLLASLAMQDALGMFLGAAFTLVSVIAQGRGHRTEPVPPEPFTGAANAISRIFLEQWITFPRFVLSGGWARNWRAAQAS
jgi:hypothetical protein